jgi:hypothetical protein
VGKTTTALLGVATLFLPLIAAALRHFKVDFESQLQDGFGLYISIARLVLASLAPEVLAGLLLAATSAAYIRARPRKRDVFWDLAIAAPEPEGERQRTRREEVVERQGPARATSGVTEVALRVRAVYDRTTDPTLTPQEIDAALLLLEGLTRDGLDEVARGLEITQRHRTKGDVVKAIRQKILDRRESFQRSQV